MTKALWRLLAVLFAFSLVAAACGGDDGDDAADDAPAATEAPGADDADSDADDDMSAEAVGIEYWLWDGNQQPFYEQCAADFEAANSRHRR